MTWATRIHLLVGVVLVLALCAALTLVLNRRTSQATSGVVTARSAAYEVTKDGTMTGVAPVDGVVTDVAVRPGGFARAGDVVATVERAGSAYVEARVLLEPADFARIRKGAEATIVLPDQSELPAEVRSIAVRNTANRTEATIEIVSDELRTGTGLAVPGTPVEASVELDDDGPLAGVDEAFRRFLRGLGL